MMYIETWNFRLLLKKTQCLYFVAAKSLIECLFRMAYVIVLRVKEQTNIFYIGIHIISSCKSTYVGNLLFLFLLQRNYLSSKLPLIDLLANHIPKKLFK